MNTTTDDTDAVRTMFGEVAYHAHMQGLRKFVRVQPGSGTPWNDLEDKVRELYCNEAIAVLNAFLDNLHPEARAHLLSIYAGIIERALDA